MNSSPTRQGAASSSSPTKSTNNVTAGPPTLLQVVAGLSASLKTAFEPARSGSNSRDATYDPTLLHSLAVQPTKDLELPLELLSSTLSAFEDQVLNDQSSVSATNNDKLRLLALSKEHSTLQLQNLQNKHGTSLAKRVLERRALYPTSFPFSVREGWTIQDILEAIAKECGLEIFPGAEEDGAGTDTMMLDETAGSADVASSTTTLTMAGKGIVLDMDVENKAKIRAVRFSYGLEGSTDGGIDKLLSKQAKERDWEALRNSLMKLARIDRLVGDQNEGATVDPFSAMKTITIKLEQLFKAELEIASSPSELLTRGHGLAITHFSEPYTLLLYYLPIIHTYSDVWQEAVQSGLQAAAMHKLLSLDGAGSIRIEVAVGTLERSTGAKVSPDISLLGAEAGDLDAEPPEGVHYVARLNKPLLVSQAAGRLLESIVTGQQVTAVPRLPSAPSENAFLTRLLPSIQAGTRYDIDGELERSARAPAAQGQSGPHYDIDETTQSNTQASSVTIRSAPSYKGLEATKSTMQASVSGAESGPPYKPTIQASIAQSNAKAFQITNLPYSSIAQFWRMIEIVRQQSMFNELLGNLFEGARVSRRVDEEAITLDDLLYTDSVQASISIFIETDLETFPPSLHISYLLPYVPGWLALSISVHITFSTQTASGLSIAYNLHGGRAELIERVHTTFKGNNGDTKLQSVLDATRSPKRCIRWLNHRLESSKHQLSQGFGKPDLV